MKVFLSGAIEGVPDLGTGWRQEATWHLEHVGFDVVSPIVNSDMRVFDEPNEIVRRNEFLQSQCDLLLAEYTIPDRSYVGTDYELVRALDWHQPAIIFAHEMYRDRVYLRYLATYLCASLSEALDYLTSFYL